MGRVNCQADGIATFSGRDPNVAHVTEGNLFAIWGKGRMTQKSRRLQILRSCDSDKNEQNRHKRFPHSSFASSLPSVFSYTLKLSNLLQPSHHFATFA
jgi:hypothetical protein